MARLLCNGYINLKLQHPLPYPDRLMGIELFKISLFKFPSPPPPKLHSNAPPNIKQFFVWSKNVVEFSKVIYKILVLLLGFSLVSIILWCGNCLSNHSLTKADSYPLDPSIKICVLYWKNLTFPVRMPQPTWVRFKFSIHLHSNAWEGEDVDQHITPYFIIHTVIWK